MDFNHRLVSQNQKNYRQGTKNPKKTKKQTTEQQT
jgi:hypothetical protein